jgi:hypothetical protein
MPSLSIVDLIIFTWDAEGNCYSTDVMSGYHPANVIEVWSSRGEEAEWICLSLAILFEHTVKEFQFFWETFWLQMALA